MTLRDLLRDTNRRLGKATTTPHAETQARLTGFLNQRHRTILRMPGMETLRSDVLTFASVASQQRYAVPEQGIARINRIWEVTNQRRLEMRTLDWLRAADPLPHAGTPVVWIPQTYQQVQSQPSDASEVFIKSTSASDTNRAYVEGVITGGYRRTADVTMTGTTAVSLDTTITTWIQIDKVYLSEEAVGTVTLLEDSGAGTELSRIAIGDTYARFLGLLLWPTPSSVITYSMDVTREIADMVNPTDEPLLPADFHDLLSIGARLDEYEHTDDVRRAVAQAEWIEGLKALKQFVQNPPDYRPVMGGGRVGLNDVGGWYPADFYR